MNNTLIYLGRWRRLGAFLIKAVFWSSIGTLIELPDPAGTVMAPVVVTAQLCYRAPMVSRHGGTLGHLAIRARVRDYGTGNPASPARAWGRATAGLLDLPAVPILVNAIMVLKREDGRHLYGLLAHTAVVEREP